MEEEPRKRRTGKELRIQDHPILSLYSGDEYVADLMIAE